MLQNVVFKFKWNSELAFSSMSQTIWTVWVYKVGYLLVGINFKFRLNIPIKSVLVFESINCKCGWIEYLKLSCKTFNNDWNVTMLLLQWHFISMTYFGKNTLSMHIWNWEVFLQKSTINVFSNINFWYWRLIRIFFNFLFEN